MYIANKPYLETLFKQDETLVYEDYNCGSMDFNIGPQPGAANLFLCYFKTFNLDDIPFDIGFGGGITLPDMNPSFHTHFGVQPVPNWFIGVWVDYLPNPSGPAGPGWQVQFGIMGSY